MTKVSYVEIPSGLEASYTKGLQPGDRFTFSRTRVKSPFLSRAKIKVVTEKSLLKSLAPVWAGFSDAERLAWKSAGSKNNQNGFRQFVQDTSQRMKQGVAGYATPNDIYQGNVGRILITSPAIGLQIEQAHPLTYYVLKKVAGTRSQYSPVAVNEPFALPLQIEISYKSDLTAIDGSAYARMYAIIISSYQGTNINNLVEILFDLSHDWSHEVSSISGVKGLIQSYSVFIEVFNATGTLYFDDVVISHSSENWARDPNCNAVAQNFTKAYVQVAKHWVATNPSDGAGFDSFYFS